LVICGTLYDANLILNVQKHKHKQMKDSPYNADITSHGYHISASENKTQIRNPPKVIKPGKNNR